MEYKKFSELIRQNYQAKNYTEVAKIAKEIKTQVKPNDFLLYIIGNSLIKTGSLNAGTNLLLAYYNSIKNQENPPSRNTVALLERDIAEQLSRLGKSKGAQKFWRSYLEKTSLTSCDTFFGNKAKYIKISSAQLELIKKRSEGHGRAFITSENPEYWPASLEWKSQFFLHIQRSGGIAYLQPIRELQEIIKKITAHQACYFDKTQYRKILWPARSVILNDECNEMIKLISKNANTSKEIGSMVATHGAGWRELYESIKKHQNQHTKIITTIRNYEQRLKSSLRWELLKLGSANKLNEIIDSTNYFNNTISLYLNGTHDIEPYSLTSSSSSLYQSRGSKDADNVLIHAVDIRDKGTIDLIKSAYLSSNQMPNIIQNRAINEVKSASPIKESQSMNEIIRNAYLKCLKKGYLESDKRINYQTLFSKTKDQLAPLHKKNQEFTLIHPYTYDQTSNTVVNTTQLIHTYLKGHYS
tara:strand:+ start:180 stop:1589 length:1410 start_codon:yes stop_codon:yes gene_type:complete